MVIDVSFVVISDIIGRVGLATLLQITCCVDVLPLLLKELDETAGHQGKSLLEELIV